MKYKVPVRCPVCAGTLTISQLHCEQCGSEIRGGFSPCRFCTLPENHLRVIETYLRCKGNIKEMERALDVSYPTARNMLDAALEALGFADGEPPAATERKETLQALERGEITAEQALARMRTK